MTREEAQALAEELVLDKARSSFLKDARNFEQIASVFLGGIQAHYNALANGGDIRSGNVLSLAACSIELLRETFLAVGASAIEVRARHRDPESQ
jgi:hypothetical protein